MEGGDHETSIHHDGTPGCILLGLVVYVRGTLVVCSSSQGQRLCSIVPKAKRFLREQQP